MARVRIGVDVGGTFTDLVVWEEETGNIDLLKVPSTPLDPSEAVEKGFADVVRSGVRPGDVALLAHGTTVGTNALLESKLARVGLLLTKGFSGIYTVDQVPFSGFDMFDIFSEKPKALLVSPRFIGEVEERVDFEGHVITPLNESQARASIGQLLEKGVEAIAVSLLFAFMNPAHEQKVKEMALEMRPDCWVFLSSETMPRIREFQRTSTVVANASIAPLVSGYLERLQQRLQGHGMPVQRIYLALCNGGLSYLHAAIQKPVYTVLSGPAAGVSAARHLASAAGFTNVISMDMGGTSCDIALISNGQIAEKSDSYLGRIELGISMLDIHTIGAGGGTIASVDEFKRFRVGPESAGAVPGPACYSRGGTEPTVTDANLVLGFLNSDYFLGGKIPLSQEEARNALKQKVAGPLGLSLEESALGIIRVTNENMEQGIKAVSTQRGYDLRDFALFAFGGAGPLHAGRLASDLGIPRVLVPPAPGLTSSLGAILTDVRHDYILSRPRSLSRLTPHEVNGTFQELESRAARDLGAEGLDAAAAEFLSIFDMRYSGQGYELSLPLPSRRCTEESLRAAGHRFHEMHESVYGHRAERQPIELVSYRLVVLLRTPKPALRKQPTAGTDPGEAHKGSRRVFFDALSGWTVCSIFDRQLLRPGNKVKGPAIVEQMDSTTVIYARQVASVDELGNLIIEVPTEVRGES